MGTRKATISVPSDPRNLFAKKREIATPLPPFYVRGIIGSENHHPPFPAIMDKAVRVRFWRVYTHVYMYTVIVCREIIIRHFFPSSTPPRCPNHALSVALACVPGWLRADRISVRVHRGLNDIALFRIERQPVSLFV